LQAIDLPEPTNQDGSLAFNKNCWAGLLSSPRPGVVSMTGSRCQGFPAALRDLDTSSRVMLVGKQADGEGMAL